MPLYIFARLEPKSGKERELLEELKLAFETTRAEPGCVQIHYYESTRGPLTYVIHSEWVDEQAFEAHAKLPHTMRLIEAVDELCAHPLQALRTKRIG